MRALTRGSCLTVSLFLVAALFAIPPTPVEARGCRIRIGATGSFSGSVKKAESTFTRFAVTVQYKISSLRFQDPRPGPWLVDCPKSSEAVSISADLPSSDPLMNLFLMDVQQQASVDGPEKRDEISAAYGELSDAARNLRIEIIGTGYAEIAVDTAWDVTNIVFPVSAPAKLVGSFTAELTKAWINGQAGESLPRWAAVNAASYLSASGLDGDNQEFVGKLIELADRTEKVLNQAFPPIVLTATGKAGDCDLVLEATLDRVKRTYFLGFTKTCGDVDESQFLMTRINPGLVSVEPGQQGTFTAQVIDRQTMNPVPISGGHTQGLDAVTEAGEATTTPAAPALNFTFTAADIKKDDDYSVTVHLNTVLGSPRSRAVTVRVLNVAPEVQKTPDPVKKKPGEFMSLSGEVTILDRNAESSNPGEIQTSGISTDGHPRELLTDRKEAELDRIDCSGPTDGIYKCDIAWNKGRVRKPHKHGIFEALLRVRDDDRSLGTGTLGFEVEDVVPEVLSLTPVPNDFMEGDGKKVGVTARIADDNGSNDIVDVELDATDAGGGKYPLAAFDLSPNPPDPDVRELEITLRTPFPHIDREGHYPITLAAMDGPPPANRSRNIETARIKVGNFPPHLCASGIIYETPQGVSRPLCPGQPFTVGVCVEDEEGDELTVVAEGPGQSVPLTPQAGTKDWVGTMNAPLEPGTYDITVTMREAKTPNHKQIVETIRITVIDCSDATDVSWRVKLDPEEVCPGESFTAQPLLEIVTPPTTTYRHPDSEITFLGQQAQTNEPNPLGVFRAPETTGTYPIAVRSNILGSETDYGANIKVIGCGDATEDKVDLLLHSSSCNLLDLGDARDPTIQLQMIETDGSFLDLEYQTLPQKGAGAETPGLWDRWMEIFHRWAERRIVHAAQSTLPEPPLIFLKSLGNSTGEAFDVQVLTRGGGPLPPLSGNGLVVEPLKKKAQERLQKEIEKLTDKLPKIPLEGKLNAYCLEFTRRPPNPGQLFQLAPPELQEKFAPMRRVLDATKRLEQAGLLNPDSDPVQYLHSVRQWAMWSEERGFDEKAFGDAFVKRTKENVEGAGQQWTKEIEQAVKGLVPNRWKDIVRVVEEAKRTPPLGR